MERSLIVGSWELVFGRLGAWSRWPSAWRDRDARIHYAVHFRWWFLAVCRTALALLLAGLISAPARADKRPWYKNPETIARHAVIVGALVADGVTTCDVFRRGYYEGSWIGHGTRSCKETSLVLAGGFGAYEFLNWASERALRRDRAPAWRFTGRWTVPAIVAIGHGWAAARNARAK